MYVQNKPTSKKATVSIKSSHAPICFALNTNFRPRRFISLDFRSRLWNQRTIRCLLVILTSNLVTLPKENGTLKACFLSQRTRRPSVPILFRKQAVSDEHKLLPWKATSIQLLPSLLSAALDRLITCGMDQSRIFNL